MSQVKIDTKKAINGEADISVQEMMAEDNLTEMPAEMLEAILKDIPFDPEG
jgi:hypothetical protein